MNGLECDTPVTDKIRELLREGHDTHDLPWRYMGSVMGYSAKCANMAAKKICYGRQRNMRITQIEKLEDLIKKCRKRSQPINTPLR